MSGIKVTVIGVPADLDLRFSAYKYPATIAEFDRLVELAGGEVEAIAHDKSALRVKVGDASLVLSAPLEVDDAKPPAPVETPRTRFIRERLEQKDGSENG